MSRKPTIKIAGIDHVLTKLQAMPAALTAELDREMVKATYAIAAEATKKAPRGASNLLATRIVPHNRGPLQYDVAAESGYAAHVEYGTKAHFPPPTALEMWVRRVLRVPEEDVKGVAFLVARAMSKRPTPAQPFMRPAYEKNKAKITKALRAAVSRIVKGK